MEEHSNPPPLKKLRCENEIENSPTFKRSESAMDENLKANQRGHLYRIVPKSTEGLDLSRDTDRRKTFEGFRRTEMIDRLTSAGFYFSGFADVVICYKCDIRLCNLQFGEDPAKKHLRRSKDCGLASILTKMIEERELEPKPHRVPVYHRRQLVRNEE